MACHGAVESRNETANAITCCSGVLSGERPKWKIATTHGNHLGLALGPSSLARLASETVTAENKLSGRPVRLATPSNCSRLAVNVDCDGSVGCNNSCWVLGALVSERLHVLRAESVSEAPFV